MRRFIALAVLAMLSSPVWAEDIIGIAGGRLTLNGVAWAPKGVTLVGRVAPRPMLTGEYAKAHDMYGADLLKQISDFGADTVRFQISQYSLDPQSSVYDENYKGEIFKAVTLARAKGFAIILSMQWEGPTGVSDNEGMPGPTTMRAWSELAPQYASMKNVMFEVFNEPDLKQDNASNWKIWKQTMQGAVDSIRRSASNLLLLDGLRSAHYLTSVPEISDPRNRIAYAVHPYFEQFNRTPRQWTENWGAFARSRPVVATEFNATSVAPSECFAEMPVRTGQFLSYLKQKEIGLTIWAFDLANVIRKGKLTNYKNFKCGGDVLNGAGQAVSDFYKSQN